MKFKICSEETKTERPIYLKLNLRDKISDDKTSDVVDLDIVDDGGRTIATIVSVYGAERKIMRRYIPKECNPGFILDMGGRVLEA